MSLLYIINTVKELTHCYLHVYIYTILLGTFQPIYIPVTYYFDYFSLSNTLFVAWEFAAGAASSSSMVVCRVWLLASNLLLVFFSLGGMGRTTEPFGSLYLPFGNMSGKEITHSILKW